MNFERILSSIILFFSYFLILSDSYVYEIERAYLKNFPLFDSLRVIILLGLFGCFHLRFSSMVKTGFLYFSIVLLYLLSGYLFTDGNSSVSYFVINFIYGFILYLIMCSYAFKYGTARSYNILFFSFLIFTVLSFIIEFYPIPRYFLREDALWQCGLDWNRRLCGATNNPNILGFISFIIASFSLICHQSQRKFLFIIAVIISFSLSFMSLSRTAILSILIMYSMYFLNSKNILRYMTVVLLLVLVLFLVNLAFLNYKFLDVFDGRFDIDSLLSASGRGVIFYSAITYLNESPIYGLGLNFNRVYGDSGLIWGKFIDNAYLNFSVSYGVLGLLVFVTLMYYIFSQARTCGRAQKVAFLSFCMILFFEDYTFKSYYLWLILFLVTLNVNGQPNLFNSMVKNKYEKL